MSSDVAEAVNATEPVDPWTDVVGQQSAVAQLDAAARSPVHAYLFLGPSGSGKRALARGFAALLLANGTTGPERERHVRLALAEQHPDLRVVEPEGMTFRRIDAENLVNHATKAPTERGRKVILGLGCEAMEEQAAGYLLKAIEEPSASTVFILLATEVGPDLVTIASRCARVELSPLPPAAIEARLAAEGFDAATAEAAASAAGGDLQRARTLASDERLSLRHQFWRELPTRLDGSGHRAAESVAELGAQLEDALGPLHDQQASELADLEEQIEQYGLRASLKRDLEARHKREARRFRGAELRFGLATLAGRYRDALQSAEHPNALLDALERIDEAGLALARYPNETLLLQALVARLPSLR